MRVLNDVIALLLSKGLKINSVYDIGAHVGKWSKELKTTVLPDARFYLFEANSAYSELLKETGFPHFCGVALSNPGRRTVTFYNGTNTGDSYYKENTTWYEQQNAVEIAAITLDEVVEMAKIETPNFIKLDTQGSELDILKGAKKTLNSVDLILTECPIIEYNKGAPNIAQYIEYLGRYDFMPIGIIEQHYIDDILVQVDMLFMRKPAIKHYLSDTNFLL